ncbi:Sphingomyelin phosphodiesterase-like 1 [Homarus americanus]|uniref:Sphingomyelin phosphodiesterase n=1 Tax=Homarus americanus TaxID=6706 RepID=A0A8J5MNQ5_HOMAM|nr:Sphingomyelin phosphodiesterase-like 1 [Homarus americanus]
MGRLFTVTFVTLLTLAWTSPPPVKSPVKKTLPRLTPQGAPSPRSIILDRLHAPALGPEDPLPPQDEAEANVMCLECAIAFDFLTAEMKEGVGYDTLVKEAIAVCVTVTGMTKVYCDGFIPLVAPAVYHILSTNNISASDACGEVMSSIGCTSTNPDREWSVTLQGTKPPIQPIVLPKVYRIQRRKRRGTGEITGTVVHLPGCWRTCWLTSPSPTRYGLCYTFPDIDYVVWTGDVVPHNMWSTSKEWNLRMVRETYEMVRKYFPNTPIFPVVGNHEMSPIDQFPNPNAEDTPQDLAATWLYQGLIEQWSHLVPHLDNSTVMRGAYYSVLVKPGFRIISFNTMFGYATNLWLVENSQDPGDELAWLEEELNKAEAAGELVHLLGHVPPGLISTERTWSREYNKIVVRYENIIRGQFYGHTHYDEVEIFHDGDRPVSVAYICPSQTPWYYLNPAYRIYHVDGDRENTTRLVLDHETYIMNLTEAQETGLVRWYQLYSAREQYGMTSLTPADWEDLAHRMAEDRELFDMYFRNYVSAGDPFLEVTCDDLCYEKLLCGIVTSNRNDLDQCLAILQRKRRL